MREPTQTWEGHSNLAQKGPSHSQKLPSLLEGVKPEPPCCVCHPHKNQIASVVLVLYTHLEFPSRRVGIPTGSTYCGDRVEED